MTRYFSVANINQVLIAIHLPTRRDGRLTWPRWLYWLITYPDTTSLQAVTHPSSNLAQCRLTTNVLTTTPCHHLLGLNKIVSDGKRMKSRNLAFWTEK